MKKIRPGDTVRVKCTGAIRTVRLLYPEIPGGVRLDRPTANFVSWNEDSLVLVKRRNRR